MEGYTTRDYNLLKEFGLKVDAQLSLGGCLKTDSEEVWGQSLVG